MSDAKLIVQDFGGTHNQDLGGARARLMRGGSWKNIQKELTPKYLKSQKQQRDWYLKNSERKRAYAKKYYAENRSTRLLAAKKYRLENPNAWITSHIKRLYNLTIEDVQQIFKDQHGACKICEQPFEFVSKRDTPHIDHDHTTGKVRGLLCTKCNISLGHLEKPGFLKAALVYLGL